MIKYEDVLSVAMEIIPDLKDCDEEEINGEMTFEELDLDSLDFIEIQVIIKKKFGVKIIPEVFASGEVSTISKMCDYIVNLSEST